jgi:hypothetical protein
LTVLVLVSSQTGFSHHLRYVLPILPFLYVWASRVVQDRLRKHRALCAIAGALVVWTLGSSLWLFPHSMCYYNELVGGPANGHFFLGNSNSDWGQDLLLLKRWYREHPEARPLYLAYDCIVDPHIAGIQYEELPEEPNAGWFAISVNLLHGHGGQNEFFLELEPVSRIGYTMRVYHLNWGQANRLRRARGLPEGEPLPAKPVQEASPPNEAQVDGPP